MLMFLAQKVATPLTLLLFPSKNSHPSPFPSLPFDQALIARVHSLLPIPNSSSSIPLLWVCRAVDFLALTFSDTATLISDPSLFGYNCTTLAAYLDFCIALLDACNIVATHIDCLLHRLLLFRFALHFLSSPDSLYCACNAIAEWDRDHLAPRAIHDSAGMLVRSLAPSDPPCGKISTVRGAIYAMEAVSNLVTGAIIAILGGGEEDLSGISIPGRFPWAETFNKVVEAVSSKLGKGLARDVEAAEASVSRLVAIIDREVYRYCKTTMSQLNDTNIIF